MVKGACADDLAALALRRSPVGYVKDRRDPLLRGYSLEHEANDQINDARIHFPMVFHYTFTFDAQRFLCLFLVQAQRVGVAAGRP